LPTGTVAATLYGPLDGAAERELDGAAERELDGAAEREADGAAEWELAVGPDLRKNPDIQIGRGLTRRLRSPPERG
jgi:hypothetical protein